MMGVTIEYHPYLKDVLINPMAIEELPVEIISIEFMLMYTYHIICKVAGEQRFITEKLNYVKDSIIDHILGKSLRNAIKEVSKW